MLQLSVILLTVGYCFAGSENLVSYSPGIEPYCTEQCPEGWDFIEGSAHCYKYIDEGGESRTFQEADLLCHQAGGHLPEFETKVELEKVRKFYVQQSPYAGYLSTVSPKGFWVGYARRCIEDRPWVVEQYGWDKSLMTPEEIAQLTLDRAERLNSSNFVSVNSVHNVPIPLELWRNGQPADEAGTKNGKSAKEEACVARKMFANDFVDRRDKSGNSNGGVDDYPCYDNHLVICQKNNILTLQQRCAGKNFMPNPPYGENPEQPCSG
jgi:hypothetical protein